MLVPFPFRHAVTDHSVCLGAPSPSPPGSLRCATPAFSSPPPALPGPSLDMSAAPPAPAAQRDHTTSQGGRSTQQCARARVCACVCVLGALQQVLVRAEGDRQQRTQCMACLAQSPFGLLVSPGGSPGAEELSPPPVADRRETGFNTRVSLA